MMRPDADKDRITSACEKWREEEEEKKGKRKKKKEKKRSGQMAI